MDLTRLRRPVRGWKQRIHWCKDLQLKLVVRGVVLEVPATQIALSCKLNCHHQRPSASKLQLRCPDEAVVGVAILSRAIFSSLAIIVVFLRFTPMLELF